MSESSESNTLSSSEDSESTQSQGNRSRSSTQESKGSDGVENTANTPEAVDWEAKYPYRFHPERDELMKACVSMKDYSMKPPIVTPWNPTKGRRDRFQGGRGGRGESHSRGKRRRDF